jgi:hypothetical protein
MEFGEEFRAVYGTGRRYRAFGPDDRRRLSRVPVPEPVLNLWETDGWAGYRDGLLWTVDPDDFTEVVAAWDLPAYLTEHGPLVPVARTALGALYLAKWFRTVRTGDLSWSVLVVDPVIGIYALAGPSPSFLARSIADEEYIRDVFREPLARRAAAALGELEWNEMYGYEPAPALGGSGEPETLRRVNIIAHHLFLSQVMTLRLQRY